MSKNNRDNKSNWYIWAYPLLLFLIALFSFKDSGGTDFDRQFSLETCVSYTNRFVKYS